MASVIDICNLALGHLGEDATVASIDPPEGSAHAEHCARFYPLARDSLLEMHPWGFATKRATLSNLGSGWPEWAYCYAQPADALNLLAVLPPEATDDYSEPAPATNQWGQPLNTIATARYTPQSFSAEALDDGTEVIYTDQAAAVLRYTSTVDDPTRFSPLFVTALSWHLASMLAGPVLRGAAARDAVTRCEQMREVSLTKARASDTGQRRILPSHSVSWIAGR